MKFRDKETSGEIKQYAVKEHGTNKHLAECFL